MDIKSGDRFGRLTVISEVSDTTPKRYNCACDCGGIKITTGTRLKRGECRSCGCLKRESIVKRNHKHGMSNTRLYRIWNHMKERCEKRYSNVYKHYGQRGIALCDEWHDFEVFKEWALNNGYSDDLTIERKDNDKGYCPDNCKWATMTEQANNKRNNIKITVNNETMTINQWAKALGVEKSAIRFRLKNGLSDYDAITKPFQYNINGKRTFRNLYDEYRRRNNV